MGEKRPSARIPDWGPMLKCTDYPQFITLLTTFKGETTFVLQDPELRGA